MLFLFRDRIHQAAKGEKLIFTSDCPHRRISIQLALSLRLHGHIRPPL